MKEAREKRSKAVKQLRDGGTFMLPVELEQCAVPASQRFSIYDQHHATSVDIQQDPSARAFDSSDLTFRDTLDANGLNRDEIAAINLYTQENFSASAADADPGVNVYWPMNKALRLGADDSDPSVGPADIRPYWSYIVLLQLALLSFASHVSSHW